MIDGTASQRIELVKHHAAGNDFLVLIDPQDRRRFSSDEVRALCDRRRGVGADGLLRVLLSSTEADLLMELSNADGTGAEMSGNGIRCLVQAASDAGLVHGDDVSVETGAGVRHVVYRSIEPGLGFATVEMGEAKLGHDLYVDDPPGVRRGVAVDMGNPHLVLLCDEVDDETVRVSGERLSHSVAGGTNVEFLRPGDVEASIGLRVYERGVGETLACGTGACAAAAAAQRWGLAGYEVDVVMRGGTLQVRLGEGGLVLGGPTRKIANVSVLEADLAALVGELAPIRDASDGAGEKRSDGLVERV